MKGVGSMHFSVTDILNNTCCGIPNSELEKAINKLVDNGEIEIPKTQKKEEDK